MIKIEEYKNRVGIEQNKNNIQLEKVDIETTRYFLQPTMIQEVHNEVSHQTE